MTVPTDRGRMRITGLPSAVLLTEGDFSAEFDISAAQELLAYNNSGGAHGGHFQPVPSALGGDAANLALSDIGVAAEPLGEIQGLAHDVGYDSAEEADERVARAKTALGWATAGASIATAPLGGPLAASGVATAIGTVALDGDALIGDTNNRLNFVTQEIENGFVIDDHLANHVYEALIREGYLSGYTLTENGNVVPSPNYYGFDPDLLPNPYDLDFGESYLAGRPLLDADGNRTDQTLGEAVNAGSGG